MTGERSATLALEFATRIERIRGGMRVKAIDALYVMLPSNVWYLSGFWEFIPIRVEAVLLPLEGDPVFIVSKVGIRAPMT